VLSLIFPLYPVRRLLWLLSDFFWLTKPHTDNPIIRNGTKKLHIAVVDTPKWAAGEITNPMEKDIWKIATGEFLRKPAPMRERYQELINQAVGKLSPTFIVYPTYRDGTIPVMMCFKRADAAVRFGLTEPGLDERN